MQFVGGEPAKNKLPFDYRRVLKSVKVNDNDVH